MLRFEDQISVNEGNFEFLVGLDTCSYRMPCTTVLGDRYLSITQKRFQAKTHLIELYKEQYKNASEQKPADPKKPSPKVIEPSKKATTSKKAAASSRGSIFDLEDSIQKPPEEATDGAASDKPESGSGNLDLAKLKEALAEIKST